MRGYAVIDCETTGLNKRGNDKIAEIAVATFDLNFNLTGQYETLINPNRDLGLTSLHKINGLMASEAPKFEEIMDTLGSLLHDRIIIGHNVEFDLKFLASEYEAQGMNIWWKNAYLDTYQLARNLRLPTENLKLGTLCAYLGIPLSNAHSAMDDVMATAELFQSLIEVDYDELPTLAHAFKYRKRGVREDFSHWMSRSRVQEKLNAPYNFHSFLSSLPNYDNPLPVHAVDSYLTTLHAALINHSYSYKERKLVEEAIVSLSLSQNQVIDLHEEYLYLLICESLTIHGPVWSSNHFAGILPAMEFTGIRKSRVEALAHETLTQRHLIPTGLQTLRTLFPLDEGDVFVLSGEEFSRGKRYWEYKLMDNGFVVKPSITKTGVRAVICNDPHSLSNKAVSARNWGVPILTEDAILRLIQQNN